MRVKPVPPPPADLEAVRAAQGAVPIVPGSEADCCGRLLDELDLASRDVARTWLSFLRGLDLAREGAAGFVRTRAGVDRETIAAGLVEGVFLGRELLAALGPEPMDADGAFEAVEDAIPRWERARDHGWRGTWRTRIGYLLDWLVLAGLAEHADGGYIRTPGEGGPDEVG